MEHRTETEVENSASHPMQPGDHHSPTQKIMGFLSEEIKPASTGLNSCTKVRIEELIESLYSEGNLSLISEWGRSPGVGNGNPLQYSCLENSMDRGARQATVHRVTKSQTEPSTHAQCSIWYRKNWGDEINI